MKQRTIEIPHHKQTTLYTCGPASLKMVLEFFGVSKTELELAEIAKTNDQIGTSNHNMIQSAINTGFYCYVNSNSTMEQIKEFVRKGLPVIINFINPADNDGHFAVIRGYYSKGLLLNDPWNGENFKITYEKLLKSWRGDRHYKKWIMVLSEKPIIQGKQYNPKK